MGNHLRGDTVNLSRIGARRFAGRTAHRIFRNRRNPSMHDLVEDWRQRWIDEANRAGVSPRLLPGWSTKMGSKRMADRCGVDYPATLVVPQPAEQIPWDDLPDTFVAKPDGGYGSYAVRVLERCAGGFWCLLTHRRWTVDELIDGWRRLERVGKAAGGILVEERVGEAPFNWKVYAFQGDVALVHQIDRPSHRARFWGPSWEPLRWLHWSMPRARLPMPQDPDGLLDAAVRLSREVPAPFVRVDMYEGNGRVLLGELSHTAGDQHWTPWWDRRLGRMWHDAWSRVPPAS